jgi:23S rRNA pseudouridine1911/1915/1917 synthase
MHWIPFMGGKGKHAISNFKVLEILAGGGAALVQWKLETGRTHQIRVHAKYLGNPLFGDEAYGGTGTGAVQVVAKGGGAAKRGRVAEVLKAFTRPALHAKTLAFVHPATGENKSFDSEIPPDFVAALEALRGIE